jgi:hypothetical protein
VRPLKVGVGGKGEFSLIVEIPEFLGRGVALMGFRETDMQEERDAIRLGLRHEFNTLGDAPSLLAIAVADLAGATIAGLGTTPPELLPRVMILQLLDILLLQVPPVFGAPTADTGMQLGLVIDVAIVFHPVLRAVDLADGPGSVAMASEMAEDRRQAVGVGARETVVTMIVGILPRKVTHPARGADGILGNGVIETHTFGRQLVQMRGLYIRMPLVTETLGIVLIGKNKENIWLLHHCNSSLAPVSVDALVGRLCLLSY